MKNNTKQSREKISFIVFSAVFAVSGCGVKEGIEAKIDGKGVSGYERSLGLLKKAALPSQVKAWEDAERLYSKETIMKSCDGDAFKECLKTLANDRVAALKERQQKEQAIYDSAQIEMEKLKTDLDNIQAVRYFAPRTRIGTIGQKADYVFFDLKNESSLSVSHSTRMHIFGIPVGEGEPVAAVVRVKRIAETLEQVKVNRSGGFSITYTEKPFLPGETATYAAVIDHDLFKLMESNSQWEKQNAIDVKNFVTTTLIRPEQHIFTIYSALGYTADADGKIIEEDRTVTQNPAEVFPPKIKETLENLNNFLAA